MGPSTRTGGTCRFKVLTRLTYHPLTAGGGGCQIFFDDLKALNIVPAGRYPRATDHIEDIVQMVEQLVSK